MSNHVNLADYFQNLGLQENRLDYHELTIEYPVLDLILPEEDTSPCLRPPQNIQFREQPDDSKYHLPLTGTDFKVRIPLTSTSTSPLSNPGLISAAIRTLSSSLGHSLLQMASYSSHSDGDSYIFRLLTEDTVNGRYQIVAESDLSSLEWEAERTALGAEKWARLADNLINRASDRAYLHVHEKLRLYSWYWKQAKGERWGCHGGMPNFDSFAIDLLPCAHEQENNNSLQNLLSTSLQSADDLRIACNVCSTQVWLSEDDLWHLRLLREQKRRAEFLNKEGFWRRLEAQYQRDGLERVCSMPSASLLHKALQHSIPSIRLPETACPRALQWVTGKEVPWVMLKLLGRMDGLCNVDVSSEKTSVGNLEASLLQLFEECWDEVQAGRGRMVAGVKSLPVEWVSLLKLWIARTVRLVLVPGYDGRDVAAVFDGGGEMGIGNEVREVMSELEDMLRDTRLG